MLYKIYALGLREGGGELGTLRSTGVMERNRVVGIHRYLHNCKRRKANLIE